MEGGTVGGGGWTDGRWRRRERESEGVGVCAKERHVGRATRRIWNGKKRRGGWSRAETDGRTAWTAAERGRGQWNDLQHRGAHMERKWIGDPGTGGIDVRVCVCMCVCVRVGV